MGFSRERAYESLLVACLRAFKTERGTGSALGSLSLGMCLHKRGQFPRLTVPTPLQVFHNCQTKHRTGEWNSVQFEPSSECLSNLPPTLLPSLPSLCFQTCSWLKISTFLLFMLHPWKAKTWEYPPDSWVSRCGESKEYRNITVYEHLTMWVMVLKGMNSWFKTTYWGPTLLLHHFFNSHLLLLPCPPGFLSLLFHLTHHPSSSLIFLSWM